MREDDVDAAVLAWEDRQPYDRLLTLDRAGWAWQAAMRAARDAPRLLRCRTLEMLERAPMVRLMIADTPLDDAREGLWGWRFQPGQRRPCAAPGLLVA
ncbi:hypothetical protein ACFO8O_13590 [Hephaestia sp. GCM10023244]|uniref:hypothetical protein n=1 Tax=unclassified Hephaestia TaxID=2631281 RepID=UPI0020775F03|nr:hypothetical protein [Hephaestia sp. MAHUQ-44]MCM8731993.1 hypothetical protein [Hephaestia sp. MAHUQ-44]